MAVPPAKAIYKKDKTSKAEGVLALTKDQKWVNWTPVPGTDASSVSLAIANITSEQNEQVDCE